MKDLIAPLKEAKLSTAIRNNVQVLGRGPQTVVFAHGFGCDQTMWRLLAPLFAQTHRVILFDLVGSGGSDLSSTPLWMATLATLWK